MKKLLVSLFVLGTLFVGVPKVQASFFGDLILNIKSSLFNIKTNSGQTTINKNNPETLSLPSVTSPTATLVGSNSATLGASLTSLGDPIASSYGICYGAYLSNPSFLNKATCVNATNNIDGLYKITVNGLSPSFSYNFVGFAKNSINTVYSKQSTFTTESKPVAKTTDSSVCEESKNYFDEYKKSSVIDKQSNTTFIDHCKATTVNATSVTKYACIKNTIQTKVLSCPNGCSEGVCLKNSYISITSPNGGETINQGVPLTIKWIYKAKGGMVTNTSLAEGVNYDLSLVQYTTPVCSKDKSLLPTILGSAYNCDSNPREIFIVKNVQMGNTFNWIAGKIADSKDLLSYYNEKSSTTTGAGKYKMKICVSNSSICDMSDDYFNLKGREDTVLPVESITVLSPNGGEVFTKGITQTIKWKDRTVDKTVSKNTNSYDISLVNSGNVACSGYDCTLPEYSIAKQITNADSFVWTAGKISDSTTQSTYSIPDGTYNIRICISGSKTCDSSDNLFGLVSYSANCPALSQTSPVCDTGVVLQPVKDSKGCITRFECVVTSGHRR